MRPRFDDKDVQLAKLAAKNLFSGDLGGRVFIVVTHSEICHNLDEQWVWLMENAGVQFNRHFCRPRIRPKTWPKSCLEF